jgi:hypothetical protein
MTKAESEFRRRQAERMHALAMQCVDLKIRDQVEAIAKRWISKRGAKSPMSGHAAESLVERTVTS